MHSFSYVLFIMTIFRVDRHILLQPNAITVFYLLHWLFCFNSYTSSRIICDAVDIPNSVRKVRIQILNITSLHSNLAIMILSIMIPYYNYIRKVYIWNGLVLSFDAF